MHKVVLSLGTNIGKKHENINRALYLLSHSGIRILKVSQKITTPPWGNWNQPDFLNVVVTAETTMSPVKLLRTIKEIERNMGRTSGHMEPRIIDVDIILFDNLIVKTDKLKIPHPSFRERNFVLKPLSEIAPDLKDPETGKTILQLYRELLLLPFMGYIDTPIGPFYVAEKDGQVLRTSFKNMRGRQEYTPLLDKLLKRLEDYFSGKKVDFTEFTLNFSMIPDTYRHIYTVLMKIPYGAVISYSQLAELSGIRKGAMTVGNAMSKNPFPILVPCHRVIRKDGKIGGFSAGKDKKIFLLKLELKDSFFNVFPKGTY